MEFKSNTLRKLEKIRSGTVFTEKYCFILELLQNAQRAKATRVDVTLEDGVIIFKDNGSGCKNPEALFTLDTSSWDTTSEGFGMGFWSTLAIPGISKIKVDSHDWKATVDVEKLTDSLDVDFKRTPDEKTKGFQVKLYAEYDHAELVVRLYDAAKYIDEFDTTINGDKVVHESIIDRHIGGEHVKLFTNRSFDAKLALSRYSDGIKVFYDKREVCTLYNFSYVTGIMEIKPNKVNLKEPDRTSLIRDEKYWSLFNKINLCIKEMAKEYISDNGVDNCSMAECIATYLEVKDYERYLDLGDDDVCTKKEKVQDSLSADALIDSMDNITEHTKATVESTKIVNASNFERADTVHTQTITARPVVRRTKKATNSFRETLQRKKKVMWVNAYEVQEYEELIAKAKYCNVTVYIAKSVLYERAFNARRIPHISTISEALKETIVKTDVMLKTQKEEAFISMLAPICNHWNLPEDCFLIANLSTETTFELDGKVVYRKKNKNKPGQITTYGLTDRKNIYLDRTALELKRFNIKAGNLGLNEIKALAHNVNTIAHELAHLLYDTTDNTIDHYKAEVELQAQILKLYI